MEAAAKTRAAFDGQGAAPIEGLPPGPRMSRALQTAIWSRKAQWFLEQSRARFGPMFSLKIAYEGDWVMLADPELVKQVFTGDPRIFHAGEGNQILRPVLGDNSVLVLDEKPHMSQRKLLLPPFHGERMQAYGEQMTEIAAREIESWPTGVPYKLRPRMQAITLEIIIETVFGVHDGERMEPLRARHEDGSPMSNAEIRDELLTLLVAGHETTATALSWAMERLTRHPEKLERLRAEVSDGEEEYLTATIQETLRLRPVIVIVVRKLTEAVELGGYELPAGAGVTPCIHLIHRDPNIYPDPDRFIPERFLDNPPGTYTWIPFGGD